MTNQPLSYIPGICKIDTPYANSVKNAYTPGGVGYRQTSGRFTDMQWMRFVGGQPEKITPLHYLSFGQYQYPGGIPRRLKDWRDNAGNIYLGMGLSAQLNVLTGTFINGTVGPLGTTSDITPLRYIQSGTGTNIIITGTAFPNQLVIVTPLYANSGDWVNLVSTTTFNNQPPLNGYYNVIGENPGVSLTISTPMGTSNAIGTGGGVLIQSVPRMLLTNPFVVSTASNGTATQSSGNISINAVTVNGTTHGASQGDVVYWTGGTNFANLPLAAGTTTIASILNSNAYVLNIAGTATANGTGGGSPVFGYGITFQSLSQYEAPGMWTLSPYGQQLIASVPGAGVYVYDPSVVGSRAYPLLNAPTSGVFSAFVTPERFVFILGNAALAETVNAQGLINGGGNPNLTILWPDQSNYTNFTPLPTNTANSGRTLQEGSYLVGGCSVYNGVSLVLTNDACYQFQYSGDNFVYNSTLAGISCGLVGPAAIGVMNNVAYWFSGIDFWLWNGQVQKIPSDDIRDYVVNDLDQKNAFKCCVGINIKHNEVWFMYPSLTDGTGENTRYVIFHVDQNCFSIGKTDVVFTPPEFFFSAFDPTPLFQNPMIADSFQGIGTMDDSLANADFNTFYNNSFITFSPIDISKGDKNMDVMSFIPDIKTLLGTTNASLGLTINIQNDPNDTIIASGPFSFNSNTGKVDVRLGAKLVGYTIQDATARQSNLLWRLGLPRIEIQPAGSRR